MKRQQKAFVITLCMILLVSMAFPLNAAAAQDSPYQQFIKKIDTRTDLHGSKPFAVVDVTGDSMPELIYVTRGFRQSDSYAYANVHVMQFKKSEGRIEEILGGYGESTDFGPQEKGKSILEIYAGEGYLVIGTGCGDAEEKEYPVKREYTWYRFNQNEMKKSEVLGYLIPREDKKGANFYFGQNESAKSSIKEAQYKSYLEEKIINVFIKTGNYPIISMSGKDGRLISTEMDRGITAAEARNRFNDLDRSFTGYFDVPGNAWYADAAKFVSQKGWMTGTKPYVFSPNLMVSRAQAVTVLYRLEGSPSVSGNTFDDVSKSDWYYKAVQWASENNIVNGISTWKFAPSDSLTREQLAAILYRYVKDYKHYETDTDGDLASYKDSWRVSGYAIDPMKWAVGRGLISGNDKHQLDPQGTATRAQFATILQRFSWQNFKLIKFTVSFEMNDGSAQIYRDSHIEYGNQVSKPNDPVRDGYMFEGWYSDSSGTIPFNFYQEVTDDLEVYAKWTKVHNVVFNMNDGTGKAYQQKTVKDGDTLSNPGSPSRNGYTFLGWYKDTAGTISYAFSSPVNGNLTLYAKWEQIEPVADPVYYSVRFNRNDGTGGIFGDDLTVKQGERITNPGRPYREGYTFIGWYYDTGGNRAYNFNDPVNDDLDLYAKWEQDKKDPYLSDWTLAQNVPAGAEIYDRKYNYKKTSYTTSSQSSLSGWTLYDTSESWGSYGSWSSWSDSVYYGSDSRQVQTQQVVDSYNMTCYVYSDSSSPSWRGYWPYPTSNTLRAHYEATTSKSVVESAPRYYDGTYYNPGNHCNGMIHGGTGYVTTAGDVPWFITGTNYKTQYRYRDRSKVYTYYYTKTEQLTSTSYPSGDGISNIQEWVRYWVY